MRNFAFVQRLLRPWQKQEEHIRLFPLPCPEHHVAFVPVHQGNGLYALLCPHCQMATQPVERVAKSDPDLIYPVGTGQEGQQKAQHTGAILQTHLAKKRMVKRLKATRLVLDFDGNSRARDTDSLEFATNLTEANIPRMPKALPHVG